MTRDELLRKWVDALESGQYEQGTEYLHRGNRFCCLGVLCDVSGIGEWTGSRAEKTFLPEGAITGQLCYLPDSVREAAGIPHLLAGDMWKWNDHDRLSFEQIAQRIREQFPDVFATVPA